MGGVRMLTDTLERRHTEAWNRLQLAQDEFASAYAAFRRADRLLAERQAEEGTQEKFHAEWLEFERWKQDGA
jgi:hypothetical protein